MIFTAYASPVSPTSPGQQCANRTLRGAMAVALLVLAWALATPAQASVDRIELINGSVIIGSFIDADNGKVKIQTDFAGTLLIDQARIAAMDVNSALTLQLDDGSVLASDGLKVSEQTLHLDAASTATYSLEHLTRINPEPWELGLGYRHSGNASSAFSVQRGNTTRDELDYRVASRWTGLRDRYTLKLEGELLEANGERSAENWMVTAKYDRFQVGDYYWGLAASIEEDRFTDLDLRTRVGPYLGRSFLTDTPFVLEVETGLSQVSENWGAAPDRDYLGLTWSLRSETDYLGNESRLYLDHSGVRNLVDRQSTILDTTLGLAFPLFGRIQGAAELVLNYNSAALEETADLDQTYRIRVGYTW